MTLSKEKNCLFIILYVYYVQHVITKKSNQSILSHETCLNLGYWVLIFGSRLKILNSIYRSLKKNYFQYLVLLSLWIFKCKFYFNFKGGKEISSISNLVKKRRYINIWVLTSRYRTYCSSPSTPSKISTL